MSNESTQPLPPNGRLISAAMASAAAIGLLLNHFMIEFQNLGKLMILGIGPIALFLGIGGIIEPKIIWSVGKYGKQLPTIYKLIGGALGALGVTVTLLLLLFVYRLGEPKPAPQRPKQLARAANSKSSQTIPAPKQEQRVASPEIMLLTYDRPNKRWVQMNAAALQGVHRNDTDGVTTLHYANGEHPLLKVVWPEVLEIGDRFTVELQGINSIEMVDLEGADANARSSMPVSGLFVVVEIRREDDTITFRYDGQLQKAYYASGPLRGDEAKAALIATALRPGFSVKKGEQVSFRNARIVKP